MFARMIFSLLNIFPMPNRMAWGRLLRAMKNRVAQSIFGKCELNSNLRPKLRLRFTKNIYIGSRSSIGDNARIVATAPVHIGDDVLIAPEVVILTDTHFIEGRKKILDTGTIKKPVSIGDDVWIGTRVTILAGAEIPDGCVVAAGAVVPASKKYPPYSVIGGVPARVIKQER
ncbi:acyltransferase [Listeria fleischmannii]|jgi:maltose O-acetyltransferase|uniref:Galactoside O-acetyltransferase n=2 Tax=Listeria fleischmannii TaxID=1069827 RepID=W7DEG4_9LIST|nr:acyltransferase [Listeria fleischmannii]EIA20441.1 galactoside O-acetyltransferase [Listeria fleischmannii subsp. coloradonensis]EUJ47541.1 galactoside O-acetyltransferase [Listeria fleischmannii FSL S10-1203]MBC1398706.1 acyltransferase [Listeria fleischmannii]MBC1418177.1 acyltransferase [Listeria fleischmannii]MBC1426950.1 acyltransferase [Listeria fleischmannii]